MGPANPWSPSWRPDPSGNRAVAIRSSRRGAFWAGLLLWPLTLLVSFTTPGVPAEIEPRHILFIAALTWPGLALLGAALAPTAIGSRIDAIVAGVALGIGAPVAAIASSLISVAIVVGLLSHQLGLEIGDALGTTIRIGVLGAVRFAPLLTVAVLLWLFLLRRLAVRPAA